MTNADNLRIRELAAMKRRLQEMGSEETPRSPMEESALWGASILIGTVLESIAREPVETGA